MYSPLLILAFVIPVPTLAKQGEKAVTGIHRKDSYGTFDVRKQVDDRADFRRKIFCGVLGCISSSPWKTAGRQNWWLMNHSYNL
jgi:hypothetical protein